MSEQTLLTPASYFSSVVYTVDTPEFLESALRVSDDMLAVVKDATPVNEIYPSVMSNSVIGNPAIKLFENFITQSAWTILDNQGYNMDNAIAYVNEMWAQEHLKRSGMEQHVHPYGVVLSGFYFLETPENGSLIEIHDPRPGKVQASLPIKDPTKVCEANNSLWIKPHPGLMVFFNSWLPHSFTRNSSDESVKFIHFNVSVTQNNQAIVV